MCLAVFLQNQCVTDMNVCVALSVCVQIKYGIHMDVYV